MALQNEEIKQEQEITPKVDSGNYADDDDDSSSSSSQSWQVEYEYEDYEAAATARYIELTQSIQALGKQFDNDLRLVMNKDRTD